MKTIIIASPNVFYAAFMKCIALHKYKPQLEVSLCGFCPDSIANKIYCNTLKKESIDVSHVYMFSDNEQSENYSYSVADWDFIMQHSIIECCSYDIQLQEILKRKQNHHFISVDFWGPSCSSFFEHSAYIDIAYMKTSSEFLQKNNDKILQNTKTFVARIDTMLHIFQNQQYVGKHSHEGKCKTSEENEYFLCFHVLCTQVFQESKNIMLAKYYATIITPSILNRIYIENYKRY
ncbi:MAG: hypothetical protein LBR55_04595 [Bacteroidales bacterium]|jgi:hypothetical protein|nr:hypothetical protein [Bacteroidales bacterium]